MLQSLYFTSLFLAHSNSSRLVVIDFVTHRPCLEGYRNTGTAKQGQIQSPFNLILHLWDWQYDVRYWKMWEMHPLHKPCTSLLQWLWFCLPLTLFLMFSSCKAQTHKHFKWKQWTWYDWLSPEWDLCHHSVCYASHLPHFNSKGQLQSKSALISFQWTVWRHVGIINPSPLLLYKRSVTKVLM